MSLIGIIVTLIVVGVLLYLINFIPMDSKIKSILNVLVVVLVILWLLNAFGLFESAPSIRLGRLIP